MQFDLRKFITAGRQPYHAEFQCDLSAHDYAGARIPQPVTAVFDAETDGDEIRMTLRANALVHGECARCLDRSPGKRQSIRSGPSRNGIWMTRISSFRWMKKGIWMWMSGSARNSCSRSPRCCFAAPTAPDLSAVRQKESGVHLPTAEPTEAPVDTRLAILKSLLN